MSVAVLGEALIDLVAASDGTFRPHPGGSPYNVAIGLSRQGIPVSYLAPFSDDAFGDRLQGLLAEEGVKLPIERRSRCPTSLALVTLDDKGLPAYRIYREGIADKDISFDEIVSNLPDGLTVFHTGSLAITPSQLPRIRRLIDHLHVNDVVVSIDINVRLNASLDTDAYLEGVKSLLPLADIVKASDEDLEPLGLGATTREQAEAAFERMGSGLLLLTEGRGGAVLFTGSGTIEKPAYLVASIADTIGAGDTFHSAFIAGLVRSELTDVRSGVADLEGYGQALDFACAAAAINVSRHGCSPPNREEVDRFIAASRR